MSTLFSVLIIISILGLLSGCFLLWNLPLIPEIIPEKVSEISLSIIIPVRNEAKSLVHILSSIKKQSCQPVEVIVVDDQSTDATVQTAHEFDVIVSTSDNYNEDGKQKTGKSAACWVGAKQSRGEWLLFLDADTYFEKADSLERVCSVYTANGMSGLLSIQPYHTIQSIYETISIICNILVLAGMNRFTPLRERLPKRGAFGPFLLCNRKDYVQIGGHKAIVDSHMDDIELAKNFQQKGLPVTIYGGKGSVAFRMFPDGLIQLVQGWSKSLIHGSAGTHPVVWTAIMLWISAGLITPMSMVLASYSNSIGSLIISLGLSVIYGWGFSWLANKVGKFPLWSFFLYPFFILSFLILFIWSFVQVHIFHHISWRGRKIKL